MVAFIIRRLLQSIIVVIIVSVMVFFLMRMLPGDPLLMYMTKQNIQTLSMEQIEMTRHEFGLDKPMVLQYFDWMKGLSHGDLGKSILQRRTVNSLIANRLPVTLYLGLVSFILANLVGVITGLIAAIRRGKAMDLVVTLFANFGITIPTFWLAIMMIYGFGLKLGWLPIMGFTNPFDNFWMSTKQLIMPIICLSIFPLGMASRQTRSSMLEVVRQDYVRTAWSKGLQERQVILKHALKNGLIPIVTLAGLQICQILGGSVIVETVFGISGMGRLAVDALLSVDYPIVQAVVLLTSTMVVISNFIVDIAYGWIDPRIRFV
jgi:peptide/nickel transport system permease protein